MAGDGHEHIVIDRACDHLDIVVPSEEEVDTVYFQEAFRRRLFDMSMWPQSCKKFDFKSVATMPLLEEGGQLKPTILMIWTTSL